MQMFEIKYISGSNEFQQAKDKEQLLSWLETMYRLGNRKRGSVLSIESK